MTQLNQRSSAVTSIDKSTKSSPENFHQIRIVIATVLICAACVLFAAVSSQTATAQVLTGSDDIAETKKQFDLKIEELRKSLKEIRRTAMKHFHSDSETAVEYREAWELAAANGEKVFSEIETHAYKLFIQPGKPEPAVARVADILSRKYYEEGKLEKCYQVAKKFHELVPQDEAAKTALARAAILCNDFDAAEENLIPSKVEGFSEIERILFMQIPKLKENLAYEMKMREKDANAEEPLPQVKLEIKNRGDVVIELYEDQAPETVGNFINLVESGFYDGMAFFRVMSHLVCETGEATLEGARSTGYEIHPEHERKDRRFHLRGSVGMRAERENVNSGSVFFIAKIPMPGLDSKHTSFGRVVSGMNHIDDLTTTVKSVQDEETKEHREEFIRESVPDVITRATVIRKRKHGKYEPNRIE